MPFSWDAASARYRDLSTGRYVKPQTVAELSLESLRATGEVADGIAAQVASGSLRGTEFRTMMRDEIKREAIRQYTLGVGGVKQMTPQRWGEIGAVIKEQYGFLDDFVDALPELSEAQIAARAKMYINSNREAFEKGSASAHADFGEERWVVDPSKENCDDCMALAAKGWVKKGTLGQLPGDGGTICLSNCGCHIEYR